MEEDEEEYSLEEIEIQEKIKEENKLSARWKWLAIINKLAKEDITKFEQVYKINYISALNLLSYWKEVDDYKIAVEKSKK